jgi:hypothetical protein
MGEQRPTLEYESHPAPPRGRPPIWFIALWAAAGLLVLLREPNTGIP